MAGLIASALAGGLTGAAEAGGKALFEQMKSDLEEQKALRIAEATEARKNAPMERFSGLVSAKMGEQVPVEAAPVTQSTAEGAQAAGLQSGLVGMTREQVAAYQNPDMLAQYDRQIAEDKRIAQEKVAGQTRPRTLQEATKAANEESFANDPGAYLAGKTLTAADKQDLEQLKIISNEKIAQARIDQRDRSDDKRFEAMMARIESIGGKSADQTALIQNAEYLKKLGWNSDKIEKFILDKKEIPIEDTAAKFLAADITGTMTPEDAARKAVALRAKVRELSLPSQAPSAPGQSASPTEATIAKLRANPAKSADFDKMFGAGSSEKYLNSPAAKSGAAPAGPKEAQPAPAEGLINASISSPATSNEDAIAKAKASNPYFQKAAPEQIASAERAVREAQSNLDASSSNAQKIQLNSALRVAKNKLEELQSKGK